MKKKELKVGDWFVCTAQKRPVYFVDSGEMDYLLNKGSVNKIHQVWDDNTIVVFDEKKKHTWFVDTKHLDRAVVMKWTLDGGYSWKTKLIAESEFDKEIEELGLTTQEHQKERAFYISWRKFLDECDEEEEVIKRIINGG